MKKIKIGDCFRFANAILIVDHFDGGIPYAIMDGNPEMVQAADIPLPTLHLPIGNSPKYGGDWFDMILSGVKKEEYREDGPFYRTRFCPQYPYYKDLKVLHLTNGYGHDKPQLWAHIESISIGRGNPEWGAPTDRDVFIIRIGDVFHTKNLKAK